LILGEDGRGSAERRAALFGGADSWLSTIARERLPARTGVSSQNSGTGWSSSKRTLEGCEIFPRSSSSTHVFPVRLTGDGPLQRGDAAMIDRSGCPLLVRAESVSPFGSVNHAGIEEVCGQRMEAGLTLMLASCGGGLRRHSVRAPALRPDAPTFPRREIIEIMSNILKDVPRTVVSSVWSSLLPWSPVLGSCRIPRKR